MERLKSGLLLVIIGLAATPMFGQQAASTEQAVGFVAVIGDVQNCGSYPVPNDAPMTVRQAVLKAGLLSQSVNVKVIRATQDKAQFTQVISLNSADSVEPVECGDVLVVQSMSPMTAHVRQNAALRTDSGVLVVALEDGTKIGDVLRDTQTMPPSAEQLRVICRFQGQPPIAKAELYSPAVHGDVISVAHDNRRSIKGFGDMSPAVSEWKSRSTSASPIAFTLNSESAQGDSSRSSDSSDFQEFQWPGTDSVSKSSQKAVEESELSNDNSKSVLALPISQGEDVSDLADQELVETKVSFASESAMVAPIAPKEMTIGAVTAATSSGFNPWNLLFVGGLLLAGTLILAGTLKPDPDDNSQFVDAAAQKLTLNLNRSSTITRSQETPDGSTPVQNAIKPLIDPTESLVPPEGRNESASEQFATAESANSLVARHEWFGGDWNRSIDSNYSAPPDESPGEDPKVDSLNPDAIETAFESPNESSASVLDRVTDELTTDDAIAETNAVETNTQVGSSDLEDLLKNRLPIDLCEAQMPLRIALFGKPAGPRRLRIDAAHATVPAPHMNVSADHRRVQPAAAVAAAAQGQTATTSGGLDSALHFLQERTES